MSTDNNNGGNDGGTPPNAGDAFNVKADPPAPPPPAPPPPAWTKAEAEAIRSQLSKPEPVPVLKPGGVIENEVNREAQAKYERDAARLNYIEQARAEKHGTLQKDFGKVNGFTR